MKKQTTSSIFKAMGLSFTSTALAVNMFAGCAFAETASNIFDSNAQACIIENYNSENDTPITEFSDVSYDKITTLNCANREISNISGLHLLSNLKNLDLSNNSGIASIDLSNNTKLISLQLEGTSIHNLDISNNPDIEILTFPSSNFGSGGLKTVAYAERNEGEYDIKMDLSALKFWNDSDYQGEGYSDYQYYDAETNIVYGKTNTQFLNMPVVLYRGTSINTRKGMQYDNIYIEKEDERGKYEAFDTHYHGPYKNVYAGDELDTNVELELIDNHYNADHSVAFAEIKDKYELARIELIVNGGSFVITQDEATSKKGIFGPDGVVSLYFYFDIVDESPEDIVPNVPNSGLFTNEENGVNVAGILLSLALTTSTIVTIILVGTRLINKSRALKF